tara:strand:+ start:484 stop:1119 length:636 start_codon:yes stop_codon:yes gene_type:complete
VDVLLEGKFELLILRNKFLKNSLEMTNKITNKAQPLFAKELSARLGYPEESKKTEEKPVTPQESNQKPTDEQSNIDPESEDDIIEAKKEEKDENLKGVFKKIASQVHPDKLQNLSKFERDYKISLFEKARMALDTNDYYGIVEVAEELGIEPPPPSRKQIELMKKTNEELENKVNEIQNSVLWKWYYADEEAREFLMSKYIEKLQQMHSGT